MNQYNEMKQVIEGYFEKLYACKGLPVTPYDPRINEELIVSEPDEEEWVRWKVKKADEPYDFKEISEELGFSLNDELKAYYGSFYFLKIEGSLNGMNFSLYGIDSWNNIASTVKNQYKEACYVYPDRQCFLIGSMEFDGLDGLFICYDNAMAKLFYYDSVTLEKNELPFSLTELIRNMEV